jgi:hypothetical protein
LAIVEKVKKVESNWWTQHLALWLKVLKTSIAKTLIAGEEFESFKYEMMGSTTSLSL